MSVVPKKYTYYGSVILFFLFGIKMIIDGMRMSPNEGQEEYEEVQAELRKKEEEVKTIRLLFCANARKKKKVR